MITVVMDGQKPQNDADALEQPTSQSSVISPELDGEVHLAADEQTIGQAPQRRLRLNFKQLWKKINVYLLIFILLIILTFIILVVSYIASQKEPESPTTALQDLSSKDLQEIASGNANIGDPRYILNVQSDAIFAGNALVKGDLNVAGSVQLGQALSIPAITVTGNASIATAAINNLTVSGATALQGRLAIQDELTVGRSLSVGGGITASQITTGTLTLGGNGNLNLNNHLNAGGQTPNRSQGSAVGSGGSSSISGSDLAGTLNINTGSGTSAGCFATITFVQRYSSTPHVIISPIGSAAGSIDYYVDRSSTNFSICTASAAPTSRSFGFDYFVVN
jgi:hypothetical protein